MKHGDDGEPGRAPEPRNGRASGAGKACGAESFSESRGLEDEYVSIGEVSWRAVACW